MSPPRLLALTTLCCLLAGSPAYPEDLTLVIRDGRVTLKARAVTIGRILAEWARVGNTRIVNLEKVTGSPVTLEFTDLPERQALDVLLRSVSGYLAAPRPTMIATASIFDRILILPTSVAPPASASPTVFQPPAPAPQPQQNVFRPVFPNATQVNDDEIEEPEAQEPDVAGPPNRPAAIQVRWLQNPEGTEASAARLRG